MVRRIWGASNTHTPTFIRVALCTAFFLTLLLLSMHGSALVAADAPPLPTPAAPTHTQPQSALQDVPTLAQTQAATADRFTLLAWNDLGMHCYNRDFQDLAVLPPYNNLYAQVVRVGNPPQIVTTTTVTVDYAFADNTYSVGKSKFLGFREGALWRGACPTSGSRATGSMAPWLPNPTTLWPKGFHSPSIATTRQQRAIPINWPLWWPAPAPAAQSWRS